ncbi:hypothetical protein NN3_43670 [Nocardia neocaledoniensis NBRC 108232]|uniref:DNA-binding transcriptional MerR regulator n=1 Tax=Nocardia neocaledoniensis TaxID=236511 RepID=A0A317ND30_9NOCA|nr:helix-turn-helix domain-containing protein [Nocardia neocaledoniensis]PWV72982.1 DNA-binding transcriptional MerR regulator [Nocardia neocaledoniensis]GEM33360.1 hypothetical protein NN3_43670 [Nocardia neocaledoniensis NBRC 108232]
MFSIGDFARHGQVSVRMLRHYDAVGLLRPARVDPATGYRFYTAAQLARLNRLVALKELGFTLEQVGRMLDPGPGPAELRGMLTLRRAELAQRIAADNARLTDVEARLRIIEKEGVMPEQDVVLKSVAAVRVARAIGVAASFEPQAISPVIQPLFSDLSGGQRLSHGGTGPRGHPGVDPRSRRLGHRAPGADRTTLIEHGNCCRTVDLGLRKIDEKRTQTC